MTLISAVIVTRNSERTIRACIDSLLRQEGRVEVFVIDNDSSDKTGAIVASYGTTVRFVENNMNAGFARAMNQGIKIARGSMILSLNPDAVLKAGALSILSAVLLEDNTIGIATPKIVRMNGLIDCAGIENNFDLWFRNRGEDQSDRGQYDAREAVFGATGACALYRKTMLEDLKVAGEYFDEDFFAYKEDVDLSWRACRKGWKVMYEPRAVAFHERAFRGFVPAEKNGFFSNARDRFRYVIAMRRDSYYRSVKALSFRNNLYLYLKHYRFKVTAGQAACIIPRLAAASFFYCFYESFVFARMGEVIKNAGRMLEKRKIIQGL
ncbi:MAG: glycosyltransferase family 2 protein [Candidatus Omnitrophica bacterium]|nr:glycosyltransferase family 2 protein [Candidatus Omnitrophota bacterium]